MKLEVGMYVKHKRGAINGCVPPRIARIIERVNNSEFLKLDTDCVILENDVLKASHNIIDLIEVGDYINGIRIIKHGDKLGFYDTDMNEKYFYPINELIINSIVTKEQFESMSYKVKE